jgi:hypothetical protein
MKKKNLLFSLLGIFLLVGAASAALVPFYPDYVEKQFSDIPYLSYSSVEDSGAITNIYLNIVQGTDLDYTLYFNDGSTKVGSIDYISTTLGLMDSLTVSLAGSSDTRTGPHVPLLNPSIRIGYFCDNMTSYVLRIHDTVQYATMDDPSVTIDIDDPSVNPIIKMDIFSTAPFSAQIRISSIEQVAKAEYSWENGGDELVSFIYETYLSILEIIKVVWGIVSFFFIENLYLTIILIEGGILAYRFNTSPDIFIAFSRTIQDNEALIKGLISLIQTLVSLIWDLVNFLNPMRWILGK